MKDIKRLLSNVDWIEFSLLIVSIVIISIMVKLIEYVLKRLEKRFPHRRMTVLKWIPLINFAFYFIGSFTSFYFIIQPSKETLIGLVISGAFALGFAAKEVFSSMIAGIILLIDKPFQVGDRITFQGFYGDIIAIGLRSVKLLTLDESIVTIPNHRFINDMVSSGNAGELGMMATIDIHVSPEANLSEIKDMLYQVACASTFVNPKGKVLVVAEEVMSISGAIAIVMRTKCIINDARFEKAFQTDFILKVNQSFKERNIKR